VTPWLGAWWPALVWAAFLFVLSSIPGTSLPPLPGWNADKLVHAVVYVVLGILCLRGMRRTSSLPRGRAVIIAAVITALYGVSDELHQMFTPKRSADWHDAVADAAGGLAGALAANALGRRPGRPTRE
jgi:VanZ family protein